MDASRDDDVALGEPRPVVFPAGSDENDGTRSQLADVATCSDGRQRKTDTYLSRTEGKMAEPPHRILSALGAQKKFEFGAERSGHENVTRRNTDHGRSLTNRRALGGRVPCLDLDLPIA
jgi:hypothetical protein